MESFHLPTSASKPVLFSKNPIISMMKWFYWRISGNLFLLSLCQSLNQSITQAINQSLNGVNEDIVVDVDYDDNDENIDNNPEIIIIIVSCKSCKQ